MSYEIILYIYNVEVRRKHKKDNSIDFFEYYENLIPFKKDKKEELKNFLIDIGFQIVQEINGMISFKLQEDNGQTALLTNRSLRFSTTGDIFEMSKIVSKFTNDKFLAIYNPQTERWEEELKVSGL